MNIASVYYWSSEATADVDFVFSRGTDILPLEVKGGENLQAKSLKIYGDVYHPPHAIRTSLSNLRYDNGLFNIPLYAFFNLSGYLDTIRDKGQ